MASKRKSEPVKKTAKRGKKKTDDSFDSDLSDDYGDEVSGNGNGAATQLVTFDERAVLPKLPEELLASRDREPGQLLIAGMVTWDIVGKRADAKGGVKIRPNLWNFHRFTEEKYRRIVSGCASAHSVLVNMDRKVLTLGEFFLCQLLWTFTETFCCRSQQLCPAWSTRAEDLREANIGARLGRIQHHRCSLRKEPHSVLNRHWPRLCNR